MRAVVLAYLSRAGSLSKEILLFTKRVVGRSLFGKRFEYHFMCYHSRVMKTFSYQAAAQFLFFFFFLENSAYSQKG